MDVLIDTSIWLLALRRRATSLGHVEQQQRQELAELIEEGRVVLLGLVRQEVLSGIRLQTRFKQVREYLRDFSDHPVSMEDHERAAEHFNTCRAHGIQGSHPDFLICALAERLGAMIFTSDQDFTRYAQHLPISLHAVRPGLA
jgi:predicted nucleic acid-binding protein